MQLILFHSPSIVPIDFYGNLCVVYKKVFLGKLKKKSFPLTLKLEESKISNEKDKEIEQVID